METNKKLNDLKNKLSQLQDELETKDNNFFLINNTFLKRLESFSSKKELLFKKR